MHENSPTNNGFSMGHSQPGSAFFALRTRGVPTDDAFRPLAEGLDLRLRAEVRAIERDGGGSTIELQRAFRALEVVPLRDLLPGLVDRVGVAVRALDAEPGTVHADAPR